MELPRATDLPFFAYGLFRRGQLGFLRLRDFVERTDEAFIKGVVLERDGLPLLDPGSQLNTAGSLFWFKSGVAEDAYRSIAELEPGAQYSWAVREVRAQRQTVRANVLAGKRLRDGCVQLDAPWDGRTDPLFTVGLEVVHEIVEHNTEFAWSLHPLFRLQMAYLLLWAAIERYASLRHRLGGGTGARLAKVAEEQSFAAALKHVVPAEGGRREVFAANDPKDSYRLDPDDPAESMNFYYQIRNNATHRGKAAHADFDLLRDSLGQLLTIFEMLLSAAFDDAKR
jgi:hypothetical protein